MAPPKRRASIVAEATNKRIAAETEEVEMSIGGGNEGLMRLGISVEKGGESLVQQVQRIRREGGEVGVGEGGLVISGADGKKGGGTPKKDTPKREIVLPRTPVNGGGNGPKGGSTLKKLKSTEGMAPPNTPVNGGGSGSLRKRSASAYLEDAPERAEQEREHKRPAKRQWRIAMPPPFQPPASIVQQNQQRLRKVLGDPVIFALTGPANTADPNHADLSNFLWAEIHKRGESPQREIFPGLPQYPVSRPGPQTAEYAPRPNSTDSLGTARKHLKMLDDLKERGFLRGEERIESHRLHTQFVKLMSDQRRDMYIKNNRPIDTEDYFHRQPPTPDFKHLALGKLKPVRTRADPALFGTWHNTKPMHEEDNQGCTFCMFDCDFGVSDERVWLPIDASGGFCRACHEATMDSYHELDHLMDVEVDGEDLRDEFREIIDGLSITAATPPLKELGDKMKFKEAASVFMSERAPPSARPQTPGHCHEMGSMGVQQQQQMVRAFNGASASRSASVSLQVPSTIFASMSSEQQQQFRMANGGKGIGNQASPEAWASFLSNLGPQQRQFMMMHLTGGAKGQVSQIMQGGVRSPPLQGSMLDGGRPANMQLQRRLSNGSIAPVSSQAFVNGSGDPNTQQIGRASNVPGGSPLMQLSILNSGQHFPIQRRLSNGSNPATPSQLPMKGNGAPNAQQYGRAINGPGRSPLMQPSMLNGAQTPHQRRLSTGNIPPPSSQISINANGTPNSASTQQGGRVVNDPSGSPLMQPSMLTEAHNLNQRQRRLSNSSGTSAPVQATLNSHATRNTQQIGRAVSGPGGSPLMQPSMLNGAHTPNQRRLSNGSNPLAMSQTNLNINRAPHTQENGRPANGVAGNLAVPPRARNGAGSPLMEGPMLNGLGNTNNVNQRRLSNSGNRPALPSQMPSNGNGTSNMQHMAQANAEGSIALTRSGGFIAPTLIRNGAGVASNTNPRPQTGGSRAPAPANATIAQRRLANGQQVARSVIGPIGIPPLRSGEGFTSAGPHPSSSSPPAPSQATISSTGNRNPQQMTRNVNGNPRIQRAGPPMVDGATSPTVPLQPKGRRLSNPPLMAPSEALPPTLRQSPANLTLSFSPILAASNPHAHPEPRTNPHRSQTAPLTPSDPMGPPPRPTIQRTVSVTDGREITNYQGVLFCRGSPWRQIDVRKARICEECKAEKFSIMKHRHMKFYLLCEKRGLREGEGIGWGGVLGGEGKKTGCMVCTETAAYGCEGCPLRLCVGCEVKLTMMCKGYLNNLIYMHGDRAHIRNDAFLLRSDGGGF